MMLRVTEMSWEMIMADRKLVVVDWTRELIMYNSVEADLKLTEADLQDVVEHWSTNESESRSWFEPGITLEEFREDGVEGGTQKPMEIARNCASMCFSFSVRGAIQLLYTYVHANLLYHNVTCFLKKILTKLTSLDDIPRACSLDNPLGCMVTRFVSSWIENWHSHSYANQQYILQLPLSICWMYHIYIGKYTSTCYIKKKPETESKVSKHFKRPKGPRL